MPHCCKRVLGQNAARMFKNPAPLLRKPAVRKFIEDRTGAVIEYGAGCLRNALFFQKRGWTVAVVELSGVRDRFPDQYERFAQAGGHLLEFTPGSARPVTCIFSPSKPPVKYDLAIMTFVVETLCRPAWRMALLRDCKARLKVRAVLLMSIRGVADVVTPFARGAPCSDGYLTPQKTFIRPYTCQQADRLLKSAGFKKVQFLHKAKTTAPELLHLTAQE
jgi:hypothetical protein